MRTRGRTSWLACCGCGGCQAQRRGHDQRPRRRQWVPAVAGHAALPNSRQQLSQLPAEAHRERMAAAAVPCLPHSQRQPHSEVAPHQPRTLQPCRRTYPAPEVQRPPEVQSRSGGQLRPTEGGAWAAVRRRSRSCRAGAPLCASCTSTGLPSLCTPATVCTSNTRCTVLLGTCRKTDPSRLHHSSMLLCLCGLYA